MTPKYCQNCGTKSESALAKFCASCGTPFAGAVSTSLAQTRKPPSRLSRAAGIDDDPEGTDVDSVPQLSKLEVRIEEDGGSEFAGFSSASSFSFNPDGTPVIRKFKPRRL